MEIETDFDLFLLTAFSVLSEVWEQGIKEYGSSLFEEFPTFNDFAFEVFATT